jgi:two-component system, chemotaxis family, sensor kinase CheA
MSSSSSIHTPQTDPYLRVRSDKITQLLDLVGELGLSALEVTHHPSLSGLELNGYETAAHQLEMLVREVQDLVSSLRLVPIGQVFHRMERVARDLVHQTGKDFEISMEGEDIEIDKAIIDQLNDPLMHLIRNSADHGLEKADEREKVGKQIKGHIMLKATQRGRDVYITVEDDGRGLNRMEILKQARQKGLIREDEEPTDQEVWRFIFKSGFSTASEVTLLSGRGVGMDVVQNTIRSIRGRIEINTKPGLGTQITLVIPLSLAFFEGLVTRLGHCLYTIPIDMVSEVLQTNMNEITISSATDEIFVVRQDNLIPLVSLNTLKKRENLNNIIIVTQTPNGSFGLLMDEIIGQQQVIMKPLPGHLQNIRGGSGCALLSSGEVAIVLDTEQLLLSYL